MKNPLKNSKISYNAPVVLSFALISFLVLILGILTGNFTTSLLFSVYRSSPLHPAFYVRLFGHVLGHSGWEHYIGNMTLFLLAGPMLEEKYGSRRLLLLIAITAFVTALVNILLFPHTALLGASGIVFMMITLSSITGVKNGKIPLTLILVSILYLGDQIFSGLFVKDNISQLSHITGGVLGIVYGFLPASRKKY